MFLVDPAEAYRELLRGWFAEVEGMEVVGEAETAQEALPLVRRTAPQVVLASIVTPDVTELECIRLLHHGESGSALIALAPQVDDDSLARAIALGAAACLARSTPSAYVMSTVQRVAAGERPIEYSVLGNAKVAAYVLRHFPEVPLLALSPERASPLSPRERQVLQEIAPGHSNREIAQRLGISEQTVKNHVTAVLYKLRAKSRSQAVAVALRNGWISAE